jgi:hypothetical protein
MALRFEEVDARAATARLPAKAWPHLHWYDLPLCQRGLQQRPAVSFDGVDDYLAIDTLAYENAFLDTISLSFKLSVNSWPAAGKKMAVITTDSSQSTASTLRSTAAA